MNDITRFTAANAMITRAGLQAAREDLDQPIEVAQGLPGIFYGSEFYELERRSLFPASWCAVTVGAAIPEPGDMQPIDLAGWPVLIVRGRDLKVRAFHNICRHRAMQLVQGPCQAATRIRCPWHAWTYDLDGRLLGMPELGGEGINSVSGFERAELGLKAIPVGQWLDYVFVNLDGKARPFTEHIAPLELALADLELGGLRHGARLEDSYAGNWKLATEGGIEDYHLPFGHPQINAHLYRNTKAIWSEGLYAGGAVSVGVETPDYAAAAAPDAPPTIEPDSRPWNARLPALNRRDGRSLAELLVFTVFPTGTVLVAADHVMLGMVLPDGPSRTKVDLHLYFDGDAAESSELEAARRETLAMWQEVVQQDCPFVAGTQATIEARDAAGIRTRFSPYWEQAVLRFQQMVLNAVLAP